MIVTYDVAPHGHDSSAKYKNEYKAVEVFANSEHRNMSIECGPNDNFHSLRVALHGHLKTNYPTLKLSSRGRTLYITRKEIE